MKSSIKSARFYLFFMLICMLLFGSILLAKASVTGSAAQKQNLITQNNDESTWMWSNNGVKVEVKSHGKIEFNDDYTDITHISPGGSFRVRDNRGGVLRRLEITTTPEGELRRSYYVQDEARPYSDEARQWFASVLIEAVRQGGFDAQARAQKILRQRGAAAVLDEISQIKSDYVKRIYFGELIKNGSLNAETAQKVLRQAAREISSDYEKAETLLLVSARLLGDDRTRSAYAEASETIHSDYERARVLSALLERPDIQRDTLLLTLKSVAGISSNYEKSKVLIKVAAAHSGDQTVRAALLNTAKTISSDYEKGQVLIAISKEPLSDDATRVAYVEAANTIHSDYERSRSLLALLKKNDVQRETLLL